MGYLVTGTDCRAVWQVREVGKEQPAGYLPGVPNGIRGRAAFGPWLPVLTVSVIVSDTPPPPGPRLEAGSLGHLPTRWAQLLSPLFPTTLGPGGQPAACMRPSFLLTPMS